MRLIICSRNIDSTLVKGDLISWHDDASEIGDAEGLFNALKSGVYKDQAAYLAEAPFTILNLPRITYNDIKIIIDDTVKFTGTRKWKIDDSALEQRGNSTYPANDNSPNNRRWKNVISGNVRRDTLRAYREITRADIVISNIIVPR